MGRPGVKDWFTRFLTAVPGRLHVAAHSHHPWPDTSLDAQRQAWLDAARHHDRKWDAVVDDVTAEARGHVARRLSLPDPATVATATNTHEFVLRLFSTLPTPARVLTTDAEFHSFDRQVRRWEEDGRVEVLRVTAEPFDTLGARLAERAEAAVREDGVDLVFVSQVLFNSGAVVDGLDEVAAAVPEPTLVVVDGYHGFMALPTDLSALADRVFYLGGGYKYAMAGEGACFLHCPPGYAPRPRNTGWYAGFGALEDPRRDRVVYADDGRRFLGATFDPTAWYRFNAAQHAVDDAGWDVARIHAHARTLQDRFLTALDEAGDAQPGTVLGALRGADRAPPRGADDRGNFLTFRTPRAGALVEAAATARITIDHRDDRVRFGFGVYHDAADVDELVKRLAGAAVAAPGT